jgi:Fic family protein
MKQAGLFGLSDHLKRLSANGDLLEALGRIVDFEGFRVILDNALAYSDGSKDGRPPYDCVSMFKIFILAAQNNVDGKPLRDHLEAVDHHDALAWMYQMADKDIALSAVEIGQMHQLILQRSKPDIAGQYAVTQRGIRDSAVIFPAPSDVPHLMADFATWLKEASLTPENAFEAHYKLVTIHPFQDGNGRASRLLMNLQLVRGGYRPVSVWPQDRLQYIDAIEYAQLNGDTTRFQTFMHTRLLETMKEYVNIIGEAAINLAKQDLQSEPKEDRRKLTADEIAKMHADRGII